MEENKTKSVALRSDIGTQVIERIDSLCEAGFTMPKDYSYVNAIKMSLLTIQETKDKNGKTALDVCTPASVQKALFKMVTLGLNAGLKQCYFIVRGNQLCCDPSYFGNTLRMKRIYPTWEPIVVVIREGDTFELGINTDTGKKFVVKHEMKLENTDNDFVGAYMYLPNGSLYVMTKRQILTAWSQSSNKDLTVHKKFDEKMISKTVINTGCNLFINTHPETENILEDEDDDMAGENDGRGGDGAGAAPALEATEFQEATIVEDATVVDGGDTTTTTSTEDAAPSEGGDEDDF